VNKSSEVVRGIRGALAASVAVVGLFSGAVHAETIAVFTWVEASGTGPDPESGSLTLTLPGTVTEQTLGSVPFQTSGFLVSGATFSELTALTYTFSNGTTVNLGEVTSETFGSASPAWETATVQSFTTGGSALGDQDLITGFTLANTSMDFNLNLAAAQSSVTNIQPESNQITAIVNGQSVQTDDSGYWKLESLTPTPLPAGLPLLLSGLGVMAVMFRRRVATCNA
jgi:hypothetical protein